MGGRETKNSFQSSPTPISATVCARKGDEKDMPTVLLTVKELQSILKMSRTKTYQIVNQPDFPKIRIGREIRIPEKELEDFLKRQMYKKYQI